MQCVDCPYTKEFQNDQGETVMVCGNSQSGAYLEETGFCGNCDWNGYEDCGTFFHVTLYSNAWKISREGLQPEIGERSESCKEQEPVIFLFPTQEDMENALSNWLGEEFGDERIVILKIRLPMSYEDDLVYEPAAGYEVQCKREIPSDYIVFLNEDMSVID